MKKLILVLLAIILAAGALSVANGNVFDLRTEKGKEYYTFNTFSNLPHLYCRGSASYGYSGIYVGDVVTVTGYTNEKEVSIKFPSGKTVNIPVINHRFKKTIIFSEEGVYKTNKGNFEVCYHAVPIKPTLMVKDIVGARAENDERDTTFVDWNNAVLTEKGKDSIAYLLITDKNGRPIPNLKGKYFTTNKYGIAKMKVASNKTNLYGNVKIAHYVKLNFDDKRSFQDGHLFVNPQELLSIFKQMDGEQITITVGAHSIMDNSTKKAYPAIVKMINGKKYVNAEAALAYMTDHSGIVGTGINYGKDSATVYIVYRIVP